MRNTSNHDCIVGWSSGVESTALVCQLLEEGRTPLLVHIQVIINDIHTNVFETRALEEMSKLLDVEVTYVEYHVPIVDTKRAGQYWREHGGFGGGWPWTPIVSNVLFNFHLTNPWVEEIYSGSNSLEFESTDKVRSDYYRKMSEWAGTKVEYICHHLEHLNKKEQYYLIPEDVRRHVRTCIHARAKECGKCAKCLELKQRVFEYDNP